MPGTDTEWNMGANTSSGDDGSSQHSLTARSSSWHAAWTTERFAAEGGDDGVHSVVKGSDFAGGGRRAPSCARGSERAREGSVVCFTPHISQASGGLIPKGTAPGASSERLTAHPLVGVQHRSMEARRDRRDGSAFAHAIIMTKAGIPGRLLGNGGFWAGDYDRARRAQ